MTRQTWLSDDEKDKILAIHRAGHDVFLIVKETKRSHDVIARLVKAQPSATLPAEPAQRQQLAFSQKRSAASYTADNFIKMRDGEGKTAHEVSCKLAGRLVSSTGPERSGAWRWRGDGEDAGTSTSTTSLNV
ncbi:hypothetical protein GN958_ATG05466 [Phytophthora infestans]|uniref:Uncharacterized protein n=1 Tax=Phytophthora infestans TaxID=4787 RepID=A0A8S9UZS6_PHYIN|nr:hypothetical protein GN958_ATG05466 [Phytophthora infestans]